MSAREDREFLESVGEELCCVCMHPLDMHINEGDGWRCHGLGPDMTQCECWLRRKRGESEKSETQLGLPYYDLARRVEAMKKIVGKDLLAYEEAPQDG